jgi:signal transduction histidine kinase
VKLVAAVAVGSLLGIGGFAASAWLAADRSGQPGRRPFVWLQVILAGCVGTLTVITLGLLPGLWPLFVLEGGVYASLALWGVFAGAYTGRGPLVTQARAAGLGGLVALTVLGIVLLSYWEVWFGPSSALLEDGVYFSLVLFHLLLLCVCLYGVFLLVWSVLGEDEVSTGGGTVLACCGLLLVFLRVGLEPNDPSPENLLATGGLFVLLAGGFLGTQYRHRPFDGPPEMGRHLARDSVFDTMSDAVIAVDHDRHVVDANAVAERLFDVRLADVVGEPITTVIEYDPDQRRGEPADPVPIKTTEGQRSFTITRSRLDGEDDDQIGHAFVFRDVTDERTQQQQLEVLNRVLRHNLRNDLDAIRGFAETLGAATDEEVDTSSIPDRIRSLSRELSEMGATVERAERLRTRGTLSRDETDVESLLDSLVSDLRDSYPECALSVSTTASELRTDAAVLETVLREVVENAIEHNDDPDPTVDITAASTAEGVDFAVRDDGDGIPEREREVLLEGEPTQLRHGTGIGLWLVSWGVTRLGGELDFEEADTGGTVVRLSIPDRQPTGSDRTAVNPGDTPVTASALGSDLIPDRSEQLARCSKWDELVDGSTNAGDAEQL